MRAGENHLEKIHSTKDLAYSVPTGDGDALVDRETLNRLIDECREEEEKRNVISEASTNRTQNEYTRITELEM